MTKFLFCCIFLCLLLLCNKASAQRIIVTTGDSLYELSVLNGNCSYKPLLLNCNSSNNGFFSIALFKDTLYYSSYNGNLYKAVLGTANSCELIGFNVTSNALTVDNKGLLYYFNTAVNQDELVQYNPYTKQLINLGNVNHHSAGDLIFYNKDLYLASVDGLVKVDIDHPEQSELYIPTQGVQFFGLINIPYACDKNKVYGVENGSLIEIDMQNKKLLAVGCRFPLSILDAASITESGEVRGVQINSINSIIDCNNINSSVQVNASTASADRLTYSLNNNSNTTGYFENLAPANYHVEVTTSSGCKIDTTIQIRKTVKPVLKIETTPDYCKLSKGKIEIHQKGNYSLLEYSLNNGAFNTDSVFTDLKFGTYKISIRDINSCTLDTFVMIPAIALENPIASLTVFGTACTSNKGSITINYKQGSIINSTSINDGTPSISNVFNDLVSGNYKISVQTETCFFDTTITVPQLNGASPLISVDAIPPTCVNANSGTLLIKTTEGEPPFLYRLNNGELQNDSVFTNLIAGNYNLTIKDANGCLWNKSASVPAYVPIKPLVNYNTKQPKCWPATPGTIQVSISGTESPYKYQFINNAYASGSIVDVLQAGKYKFNILNNKACIVDSLSIELKTDTTNGANCDTVYIPNAFTPDGNGINDVFRSVAGSFINDYIFKIYNRYGQLVFETKELMKGWDGTIRNQKQPGGTYVWMLQYKTSSGNTHHQKGTVVLLR